MTSTVGTGSDITARVEAKSDARLDFEAAKDTTARRERVAHNLDFIWDAAFYRHSGVREGDDDPHCVT